MPYPALNNRLSLPAGPCILLDLLPPELLQIIIAEHLEDRADIQALSRTCHALHSLTGSPALEAAWLWRWHGHQAFFQTPAVISLSLAVLRQLVEVHHADVNARSADDHYPLLRIACQADRADLVGYLASAPGIDVNKTFWLERMTPLHVACYYGSVGAARQLLALPQIQVNVVMTCGTGALQLACTTTYTEVVKELLRHPDIDVNLAVKTDSLCATPLSSAAARGEAEIVTLLLQHPAINVNAGDRRGTSLHRAVRGRHVEVLRQLLRHPGIQVNELDEDGKSSFYMACSHQAGEMIAEFLRHPDINVNLTAGGHSMSALSRVAVNGDTAAMDLLLQHPATQVNEVDVRGNTALYYACSRGKINTVRALLRHPGIEVNAAAAAAHSSLGIACAHVDLPVIRELLEQPGLSPGSIRAAFAEAEERGQTAVVALLRGSRAVRRALREGGEA